MERLISVFQVIYGRIPGRSPSLALKDAADDSRGDQIASDILPLMALAMRTFAPFVTGTILGEMRRLSISQVSSLTLKRIYP